MAYFAVIHNGAVSNVMVAETQDIAEQLAGFSCLEYTQENPLALGQILTDDKLKEHEKNLSDAQTKLDAEAKAIADAEAARHAEIEKNRIDEAKPVSLLPKVTGKFKASVADTVVEIAEDN